MKYKVQIIGFLLLCVVFGALGAVWQFYFKDIFEGYRQDERLRETLESNFSQLQETFQGYKPELLIEEWQNKMQPWRNAREDRAGFFNFGDWYDVDVTPDETRMLKFWYTEVSNEMVYGLYGKVYETMMGYDRFPNDIQSMLGIPREEDWGTRELSSREVLRHLQELNFGIKLSHLLLDSGVTRVYEVVVWPRRVPGTYRQMLGIQTVGLHIQMPARELMRMLEELRLADRFFAVDAIKISYPYIAYPVEPQLDVRLLLSQATYRRPPEEREAVAATPGAPGVPEFQPRPMSVQRTTETIEPNMLQRMWIWFRRNILYLS